MMIPLNFEKPSKLLTSLGIIFIFVAFLFYIGYAWVIDQQTNQYIETQLKIIELKNKNSERVGMIDTILKEKADAVVRLGYTSNLLVKIFGFGGIIIYLIGFVWWSSEKKK